MAFVERTPPRKVHIVRILGTNRDGEVLPDMWADVERFEAFARDTQIKGQYQKINTTFRWHDDPDNEAEYLPENDEGTARNTKVLKVCSPDEADLDDPEQWVPVRVIKQIYLHEGGEGGVTQKRLITDVLDSHRRVETRRIYHYDTNVDDDADAAFAADPTRKAYVIKGFVYEKDDATKDEDQYIEIEIVTAILKYDSEHEASNGDDQQAYLKLKNQYLLDETEPALLEETGANDRNPPYRLDPFQNIVNVQFKVLDQQWLLGNGPQPLNDPIVPPASIDPDGLVRNDVTTGASGSGHTVFAKGFVAYGKITVQAGGSDVSKSVFLAGTYDGVVSLGTIVNGELQWQMVKTYDAISAISYANETFFVSHFIETDGRFNGRLGITTDGTNFITANPFAGLSTESVNGIAQPIGSVVYDGRNAIYVLTGSCFAGDDDGFDLSFAWATSINGLDWSASMDAIDVYSGTGGQFDHQQSSVAFGNGIFVAATSKKHRFAQFPEFPDAAPDFVMHECAVSTSTNGSTWTLRSLPGTVVYGNQDRVGGFAGEGNTGGDTYAVAFVKDKEVKKDHPGSDGYFLAAGSEFSNRPDHARIRGMLWKSFDGLSWSLIKSDQGPPGNTSFPPGTLTGAPPLNSEYATLSATNKSDKLGTIKTAP